MPRSLPSRTRLAISALIALCAGLATAYAVWRYEQGLPPFISPAEFSSEMDQGHVSKVVVTDRELISGTSSTHGPFRVRMRVDEETVKHLRARGLIVEFETSSDLTP
jgi:hypothetical protein